MCVGIKVWNVAGIIATHILDWLLSLLSQGIENQNACCYTCCQFVTRNTLKDAKQMCIIIVLKWHISASDVGVSPVSWPEYICHRVQNAEWQNHVHRTRARDRFFLISEVSLRKTNVLHAPAAKWELNCYSGTFFWGIAPGFQLL
jgi:hypothetical protein